MDTPVLMAKKYHHGLTWTHSINIVGGFPSFTLCYACPTPKWKPREQFGFLIKYYLSTTNLLAGHKLSQRIQRRCIKKHQALNGDNAPPPPPSSSGWPTKTHKAIWARASNRSSRFPMHFSLNWKHSVQSISLKAGCQQSLRLKPLFLFTVWGSKWITISSKTIQFQTLSGWNSAFNSEI